MTTNLTSEFKMRCLTSGIFIVFFAMSATTRGLSAGPQNSQAVTTSFEEFPVGDLKGAKDSSGRWEALPGHATVQTQHQHSGQKSLRLNGGDQQQVVWIPQQTSQPLDQLEFRLQRWTQRSPYLFRVETLSGKTWKTIYEDQTNSAMGAFVPVKLALVEPFQKIRFSCTTPDKAGVLLDDVALSAPGEMSVSSVTVKQETSPVLVRNPFNPVLAIDVVTVGRDAPLSLKSIDLSLAGTTQLQDIASIEVLNAGKGELKWNDFDSKATGFPRFGETHTPHDHLGIAGHCTLQPGLNRFYVSLKLTDNASLDHRINAQCPAVEVGEQKLKPQNVSPAESLRIGCAVRRAGEDQSAAYRIPGIATTNRGTLIAVYDVRRRGWTDLPNDIDIGVSRSTDGGQHWEPMRIALDMGSAPAWKYDGIGDPSVLVDETTNTVWVAATWSHGARAWVGSGPGMAPEETGQLILAKSVDDGQTWSAPINITSQVKKPEWSFVLPGPGRGITMQDGTLVFPAQYQDAPDNNRLPHSTIIYSRDHGVTWQIGNGAFDDTTECAVAEIEPGVLMLNCRNNRRVGRVVMITHDLGKTWTKHPTSQKSLPEPGACMGSLFNFKTPKGDWLLFSNPNVSESPRRAMTIKASDNAGMTWPEHWQTLIDEGQSAGYSCLTKVDDKTVGLLFEGSRACLAFVRIPLSELTHVPAGYSHRQKPELSSRLQLAPIFTDHLVLQRDVPVPVWGTGPAGTAIEVTFATEKAHGVVDERGKWMVHLPSLAANSHPTQLVISTPQESVEVNDVLVGEVWIASGQSNMAWPLKNTLEAEQTLETADDTYLRLYNFREVSAKESGNSTPVKLKHMYPDEHCQGHWDVSSSHSANEFSAVAYHFSRTLRKNLKVPVGIICSAIGGTPTESWIRTETLRQDPVLNAFVQGNWLENDQINSWCRERATSNLATARAAREFIPGNELGPYHPFQPGFMWTAGVDPLVPFPVKGVIWYQGESNAISQADVEWHQKLLPLLIEDWRQQWKQPNLPFLFVQLPALNRPHWPAFRDGQRRIHDEVSHTGMAITIDTGERENVHPRAKQIVGERLARSAFTVAYHQPSEEPDSGPLYVRQEIQGDKIRLHFRNVGSGLISRDGLQIRYFEVAGEDGVYHSAQAQIDDAVVVLTSSEVKHPQSARYAWIAYPDPAVNLFNQAGLPASPFQTTPMISTPPSAGTD